MPCGEYFTDYVAREGLFRWRIQKVTLVLAAPIPVLLPFVLGGGMVSLFTQIYIFAIAVLGLNVILGYTGEIVLAQGAFMAIGAYTTAQLLGAGAGVLPSVFVGGVLTALVAVAFGLPSFRVKGFYVAISTLALQFISIRWFFTNDQTAWLHGGTQQNLPLDAGLVGPMVQIGGDLSVYYLSLIAVVVFAVASLNISRSGIGRTFRAVNENDLAAAVLGIDVFRNKLYAFAIGGFMVGVAGGLYGFYLGFFNPEFFSLDLTLQHYVMLLFGGTGRVWGALLGTGIVALLRDGIRDVISSIAPDATALLSVVFGVIIIVVLAVEPKGVLAGLGQIKSYLRNWPFAY